MKYTPEGSYEPVPKGYRRLWLCIGRGSVRREHLERIRQVVGRVVCSYPTQDAALRWALPGEAIVPIDVPDDVFDGTFLQRPRVKR